MEKSRIKVVAKNQDPETLQRIQDLAEAHGYEKVLIVDVKCEGESCIQVRTPCSADVLCELDGIEDVLDRVRCEEE